MIDCCGDNRKEAKTDTGETNKSCVCCVLRGYHATAQQQDTEEGFKFFKYIVAAVYGPQDSTLTPNLGG